MIKCTHSVFLWRLTCHFFKEATEVVGIVEPEFHGNLIDLKARAADEVARVVNFQVHEIGHGRIVGLLVEQAVEMRF